MDNNFVLNKEEIITSEKWGLYGTPYSKGSGMMAHFIITNQRIYCEYGELFVASSVSIYYNDIIEIKTSILGNSITIKDNKKASNGKFYKNTHILTFENPFSETNTKVFEELVEIVGEDKVIRKSKIKSKELLGIVLFVILVLIVLNVSV